MRTWLLAAVLCTVGAYAQDVILAEWTIVGAAQSIGALGAHLALSGSTLGLTQKGGASLSDEEDKVPSSTNSGYTVLSADSGTVAITAGCEWCGKIGSVRDKLTSDCITRDIGLRSE